METQDYKFKISLSHLEDASYNRQKTKQTEKQPSAFKALIKNSRTLWGRFQQICGDRICIFKHHSKLHIIIPVRSITICSPDGTHLGRFCSFLLWSQLMQHSHADMWRAIRLQFLIPNLSNIHMQSGPNICYNWSQRRGHLCSHMPKQSACRMFSPFLWIPSPSSILLVSSCSCPWILLSSNFCPSPYDFVT